MKPYLLCLFLAASVGGASLFAVSENPLILPLWEGPPPNHRESDLQERSERKEILLISQVQDPAVEVRLPAGRNRTGQAVLICPGGGYGVLAYDWEGIDIASWLNAHGIAAIILKYRLPEDASNEEPHLSPLLDASRAMRLTRHHAEEWGIDPQQIGVMGFSAGGHLASTLGTRFDEGDAEAEDPIERLSSRPDFMILMYPVISMRAEVSHTGSRRNLLGESPSEELVHLYSSELQVTERVPPTFIVHSSDDQTVPVAHSLLFYQALLADNVPVECHLYPYGGHGYSLGIGRGRLQQWSELCIDWMESLAAN